MNEHMTIMERLAEIARLSERLGEQAAELKGISKAGPFFFNHPMFAVANQSTKEDE